MHRRFLLSSLLLPAVISAAPCNITASRIAWGLCEEAISNISTTPIDCANLIVPLDYSNSSSLETLKLELARIPATVQPSRGSILFNFGGPGAGARSGLAGLGDVLQAETGGMYDLVAFDPRGTENTIPFNCYQTELEEQAFLTGVVLGNSSNVALGNLWAQGQLNSRACLMNAEKVGSMIGTPFVARDLISVVDALGEDGKLRFWGLSYGTTLGATVAAMFPDRIDKMILDGVQNPHEYYNGLATVQQWTQSDAVFSNVFTGCVTAGPANCALAKSNSTGPQLEAAVWDLIDQLKFNPITVGPLQVDFGVMKGLIQTALYDIVYYPALTFLFAILLDPSPLNETEFLTLVEAIAPSAYGGVSENVKLSIQNRGIQCGDRNEAGKVGTLEEFLPAVDALFNVSRIFGDGNMGTQMACAQWEIETKERYLGNFETKTSPILVISNKGDAFTPVVSGYNISASFEGSSVLEIDGYGVSEICQMCGQCPHQAGRQII